MLKRKNQKLKIGFDLDGVLADFTDEFVNRLNASLMEQGRITELVQLPVTDYWFLDNHLDFFEESVKMGIFADCSAYPEAAVYVNKLLSKPEEFEVYFVTARGTETGITWAQKTLNKLRRDTKDWVKGYFPTFNLENLHFCHRKDGVVVDNGIEAFIEDRADTAARLSRVCKSFLLERDWNKNEPSHGSIRIKSLLELDFFMGD